LPVALVLLGGGALAALAIGLVSSIPRFQAPIALKKAAVPTAAPIPPVPAPENADDWEEQAGFKTTWVANAATIDGERVGVEDLPQFKLVLFERTRRYRLHFQRATHRGDYQMTQAGQNRIDLKDDMALFVLQGIYSLKDDTLTVSLAELERPSDFTAKEGSRRILLVLKRQEE
jgi:hypothetical protein